MTASYLGASSQRICRSIAAALERLELAGIAELIEVNKERRQHVTVLEA